ncbi:hypothetical protein OQA88_8606 [Cercophora sp. LCS_1]
MAHVPHYLTLMDPPDNPHNPARTQTTSPPSSSKPTIICIPGGTGLSTSDNWQEAQQSSSQLEYNAPAKPKAKGKNKGKSISQSLTTPLPPSLPTETRTSTTIARANYLLAPHLLEPQHVRAARHILSVSSPLPTQPIHLSPQSHLFSWYTSATQSYPLLINQIDKETTSWYDNLTSYKLLLSSFQTELSHEQGWIHAINKIAIFPPAVSTLGGGVSHDVGGLLLKVAEDIAGVLVSQGRRRHMIRIYGPLPDGPTGGETKTKTRGVKYTGLDYGVDRHEGVLAIDEHTLVLDGTLNLGVLGLIKEMGVQPAGVLKMVMHWPDGGFVWRRTGDDIAEEEGSAFLLRVVERDPETGRQGVTVDASRVNELAEWLENGYRIRHRYLGEGFATIVNPTLYLREEPTHEEAPEGKKRGFRALLGLSRRSQSV